MQLSTVTNFAAQGDEWLEANVPIDSTVTRIVMNIYEGDGDLSNIAIDDVTLEIGSCSPEVTTEESVVNTMPPGEIKDSF